MLLSLLLLLASSIVIALAGPGKAYACEVLSVRPLQEAHDNSVAIFAGRVVNIQNFTVEGYGDWHLVSFEVDRYWKIPNENNNDDYKQLIVFTGTSENVCGYEFEKGKDYLVYAIKWWHDPNSLYTGLGYRNQPVENAQEDLAFLGEGKEPTKELSWDEQINRITIQPLPTGQEEQAVSKILSMVGIGVAISGAVAFFSLRRLKEKSS